MSGAPQPCTQPGCEGQFVWGRTHRDPVTGKGGTPCPVDWPFPIDRRRSDGTVLAPQPGRPVPNVGLRKDQHGTWIARVATVDEPIRADETPGYMHHVTCRNPPQRRSTTRRPATKNRPPVGQDTLALDLPTGAAAVAEPGPLSNQALFPPRRTRRG